MTRGRAAATNPSRGSPRRELTANPGPVSIDVKNVALEALNNIEANAGTGKTWTITALYVRLLLELGRSVESILVVTFTEAATAELRDRIRTRLAETRAAFALGGERDDDLIATLLTRIRDREEALLRLTSAIRDFDKAPIYTIHGFCQRVLGDSAFESGMPFATEIVPDQSALLQEIIEDFWRKEVDTASALFARFLVSVKLHPDALRSELARYAGKTYLDIRGPDEPANISGLEHTYARAFGGARRSWLDDRKGIAATLMRSTSLSAQSYKQASIAQWLEEMHACLCSESVSLELCDKFDRFTTEALRKATKKGGTMPSHPFFDACQQLKDARAALIEAYERRVPLMKARLLRYCNAELTARKAHARVQSYDDLLLNLDNALQGEPGATLAANLRERYSAALIDEFQDTDPVQYSIFRRIYGEAALPVFFVGDPKQSIYGFRGADVFSYLKARSAAKRAHTLDVNWRSGPALLRAVNCLFENAPAPFVIDEIPFHPSQPAPGSRGAFVVDDESGAALTVWIVESEQGKPVGKTDATTLASKATAAEIARLLNLGARGRARIVPPEGAPERALRGGDIAVLVRNHRQAQKVREALAKLGVASVQRGAENVFSSCEAGELERVLLAIAEPGRESLIGAALATEMMGLCGHALYALRADENAWEQAVETFRDAHREWRERGFIPMLRNFLHRYDVVCRLLGYADGERRVTNLQHLGELLHCDADQRGMSGLIAWLSAKRKAPDVSNQAEILRLESDENLVKILTIHVAKGLEYPLVFCPFLWDGKLWSEDDDVITFHDFEKDQAVLDFGSDAIDRGREQALLEERAENMRLLYVALTRAKHRCWMVWGDIKDAAASAPARLLHPPREQASASAELGALLGGKPQVSLANMRADLERLASSADGAIGFRPLPLPEDIQLEPLEASAPRLAARVFTGSIRDTRRVTSFTGLAHGRAIEAPDYDAADRELELEAVAGGRDIFAFPRGAQAGKCLHAIFENLDFTNLARPELERIVGRELSAHGFESIWVQAVSDMVEHVAATPLDESGALRLDRVSRTKRLDELEFYYPLAKLTHAGLRQILLASGFPGEIRDRIGELTFATMQGYMRGFIDIVFEHDGRYYLADYKSNWLGATVDAYQHDALVKVMGREAYYLQYLVYCVALHRYLQLRVRGYSYEAHFGGVRYLFVRGMRPQSGVTRGVYADKPAFGVIEALDRYLKKP